MPIDVTDANLESSIQNSKSRVILVDFWAAWCGPCHVLAPTLAKLEEELEGKLEVLKLNVDENPNMAEEFQIQGLPTLVLFSNKEPEQRITGVVPYHDLKRIVERFL